MSFEIPYALLGLLFVPVAIRAYVLLQRRRQRYAVRFTNLDLLANVVSESPGWRRHLPPLLTLLALTALLVALARPHWTFEVPRTEASVVLATDTSGSMNATDVEPSRLVAAEQAATTFVEKVPPEFKVGLVSFSRFAEQLVAPTVDRQQVNLALRNLKAEGGTAMGDGLRSALDALEPVALRAKEQGGGGRDQEPPATIVLLSDGKNTTGSTDPVQVAERARSLGIPINTVALGTAEGTIDVENPLDGTIRTVAVPPDRPSLERIAETSGGRFFDAPRAEELEEVYAGLGARIGFEPERREVTLAFVGGGLVLLLVGGVLSLAWFGRIP